MKALIIVLLALLKPSITWAECPDLNKPLKLYEEAPIFHRHYGDWSFLETQGFLRVAFPKLRLFDVTFRDQSGRIRRGKLEISPLQISMNATFTTPSIKFITYQIEIDGRKSGLPLEIDFHELKKINGAIERSSEGTFEVRSTYDSGNGASQGITLKFVGDELRQISLMVGSGGEKQETLCAETWDDWQIQNADKNPWRLQQKTYPTKLGQRSMAKQLFDRDSLFHVHMRAKKPASDAPTLRSPFTIGDLDRYFSQKFKATYVRQRRNLQKESDYDIFEVWIEFNDQSVATFLLSPGPVARKAYDKSSLSQLQVSTWYQFPLENGHLHSDIVEPFRNYVVERRESYQDPETISEVSLFNGSTLEYSRLQETMFYSFGP